jgi:SnoaL-like domain
MPGSLSFCAAAFAAVLLPVHSSTAAEASASARASIEQRLQRVEDELAMRRVLVDLYGTPPPGYVNAESFHISSNPQVDVQGDRATARSRHLLVMRGPNGQPTPMLAGRYEDEFIREDGQWKILRRVDYPVMPTSEEWMKIIRERNSASQIPR